jgi:hypothetical protein
MVENARNIRRKFGTFLIFVTGRRQELLTHVATDEDGDKFYILAVVVENL